MKPEDRARERFTSEFGRAPAAVASAPGRINLIGEHVDNYGGHVLPVATRWRTAVAVGRGTGLLRAVSEHQPRLESPWPPQRSGQWSDYVAGVAALWAGGSLGGGLDVAVASDVPVSSGVSSSAALEVATAFALAALTGTRASARELAELAWRAETGFVGVPCGKMDQFGSALAPRGAALLLDCRSYAMSTVRVDLDLVLADSGESRGLRSSAYADRRADCDEALRILNAEHPSLTALVDVPPARLAALTAGLPEKLSRRVRHVVTENQRTLLAARALEGGDHAAFGLLVNASHASLRDLYECSTPRLDAIAEAARALPDALGARLMGAGWGGCVLIAAEKGGGGSVADRLLADKVLALPAVRVVQPGAGAGESWADRRTGGQKRRGRPPKRPPVLSFRPSAGPPVRLTGRRSPCRTWC